MMDALPWRAGRIRIEADGGRCQNFSKRRFMLEGTFLMLDIIGMLMVMFWCIREEAPKTPRAADRSARP